MEKVTRISQGKNYYMTVQDDDNPDEDYNYLRLDGIWWEFRGKSIECAYNDKYLERLFQATQDKLTTPLIKEPLHLSDQDWT